MAYVDYDDSDSLGRLTASSTVSMGGLGFMVFMAFLILKCTGTVGWSWFWVCFPLWIGGAVALAFFLLVAACAGAAIGVKALIGAAKKAKAKRSKGDDAR